MSKKIAEGIGGLVLDVKFGDGAFMKTEADARALARVARRHRRAGRRPHRGAADADGRAARPAVGNALEIIESIETLKGRGPADARVALGRVRGADAGPERDRARPGRARPSGCARRCRPAPAWRSFARSSRNQGGDPRGDRRLRPPAGRARSRTSSRRRVTASSRTCAPRASAAPPSGSARAGIGSTPSSIHAVGFMVVAPVGTRVKAGDPIVEIHHRNGRGLADARRLLDGAIEIADAAAAGRAAGARSHSGQDRVMDKDTIGRRVAFQPPRAALRRRDLAARPPWRSRSVCALARVPAARHCAAPAAARRHHLLHRDRRGLLDQPPRGRTGARSAGASRCRSGWRSSSSS